MTVLGGFFVFFSMFFLGGLSMFFPFHVLLSVLIYHCQSRKVKDDTLFGCKDPTSCRLNLLKNKVKILNCKSAKV